VVGRAWACAALVALVVMVLVACGGNEAATSVPATARAAATTAATNIPQGANATAASAATTVATNVPGGVVSTAAALATGVAATANAAGSAPVPAGPQATVTGEVTKVDPAARTFTVQGADGKDYDFSASAGSQVDLAALAANLASKQQVTVTYSGTAAPYLVVSVR